MVRMPVEKDYKHSTVDEVLRSLKTSKRGLTSEEAKKRLGEYGPNEIPEKKVNPLLKFLSYFWGPIPWMIEIAAVLSALVRHWADFWIIATLVVVYGIFVTPIGWKLAGLIWAYALVWMLVIDEAKVIVLKRMEGL